MTKIFSVKKKNCYLEKDKKMCEDLLYVVNNYEEDVTLYFKHII